MPQLVSDAPGAPAQGKASIPLGEVAKPQLPQPTREQTVTAVQRAVTRNQLNKVLLLLQHHRLV